MYTCTCMRTNNKDYAIVCICEIHVHVFLDDVHVHVNTIYMYMYMLIKPLMQSFYLQCIVSTSLSYIRLKDLLSRSPGLLKFAMDHISTLLQTVSNAVCINTITK